MDHAKRRIAVLNGINDDPHGKQIIDLVYRLILVLHLPIDTEEMFHTSVNLCLDSGICYVDADFVHNILNEFFSGTFPYGDLIHQIMIRLRLQIF